MVGIIPMLAAGVVDERVLDRAQARRQAVRRTSSTGRGCGDREQLAKLGLLRGEPGDRQLLLGVVGVDRLERLFEKLFDPAEFLSPYGLRALSAYHREHPYELDGGRGARRRSTTSPPSRPPPCSAGNSNWRGPVWFPLNYLVVTSLERYHRFFGDDYTVEYPTGSGGRMSLDAVGGTSGTGWCRSSWSGDGRRPCFGGVDRLQRDPRWKDNIVFSEYFHGDNGAGLGAAHQTGWTGLVADLIRRRHGAVTSIGDLLRALRDEKGPR